MRNLVLIGLAAAALGFAPAAQAEDLTILSAAAVRPALIEVPPLYTKTTGHRVTVSFGNATAIESKVVAGEPVDVVILPPPQLDGLIGRGFLAQAGRSALGAVRLGLAARSGTTQAPVGSPDALKQALLDASSFGMPDPADGSTSRPTW
jgi:molybdate transport system substrate-binding protein